MGADVVAYRRGSGLTCVVNFGDPPVALPDGATVVLRSGADTGATVDSDDAVWFT